MEADTDRADAFSRLVDDVRHCRTCPRMEGRARVLSEANGPLHPLVCFIAEAPGRLGGDRTMIPLTGDQSGRNFTRLLAASGLERPSVFVTNAVLCNPRDSRGRNAPPSTGEVRSCSRYLSTTLHVLQPAFVVTLGSVALRALTLIEPHGLKLATTVGEAVPWHGRWLVPLYHPSPRAQLSRSFEQQIADFQRLGRFVRDHIPDSPAGNDERWLSLSDLLPQD